MKNQPLPSPLSLCWHCFLWPSIFPTSILYSSFILIFSCSLAFLGASSSQTQNCRSACLPGASLSLATFGSCFP